MLIHRINGEPNAEELQETINDREWEDFAKWMKMLKE
jgi:hypothetical protein